MSPVSRGRKKKPAGGRKKSSAAAAENSAHRRILAEFAALEPTADLLEVEVLGSEAAVWRAGPGEKSVERQLLDLIAHARRHPGPGAANLLATLRVFAVDGQAQSEADAALRELMAAGVEPPPWTDVVGRAQAGACWLCRDRFDEEHLLLCVFERAGEPDHGLLVGIGLGGEIDELELVENPAEVLAELRANLAEEDTLERVSGSVARRQLAHAIVRTHTWLPENAILEGLLISRQRLLGDPPPDIEDPEVDVEAAARRFFAANPDIEDDEEHRELVEWLVEFSRQVEPRWAMHIGPELLVLLADELPEEASPELLEAWIRWRAAERELSEDALDELLEIATGFFEGSDPYLDGVGEDEDVEEVLDRRQFALPEASTTIGDEEVDLDPNDLDDRVLLVLGEHPELHEAVANEELDPGSAELLGTKAMVVHQLWDNDPPEVWAAARALRDRGVDRQHVLERLRTVLLENASPESDGGMELDIENYRRALTRLS
ncbi:hypothetical protein [Amycolatopsis magusensis]|uniref:hypothetical protein n=1 Tax=Amycolatopsis magusensis TaxID=882444 RepID=UPI003C2B0568